MPWSKSVSVLVDLAHNNLINPTDPDFRELFEYLKDKGYNIIPTLGSKINFEDLTRAQIFLLGVPQNAYFLTEEINGILDFVRNGGSLILVHRYGGDLVQKTNLNEISSYFGFYFENTLVKDTTNAGVDTLPIFTVPSTHPLLKGINKIILAGCCTIRLAKDAKPLVSTSSNGWVEIFNPHSYDWVKDENQETISVVAYSNYGQGRILALGTSDFLSNKSIFGISSLDNRKFFQNLLTWLIQPVSETEVRDWMLTQLGSLTEEVNRIKMITEKFQSTLNNIETRVNDLERNFYAQKGVHLPVLDEDNI